jgi:tRNA-specific 2-thiouridylase
MNKKALIAMSGGVDSSVAAYLTQQEGFSCIGVTMKLFQNEEIGLSARHTCCSLDDVEDARSVAEKLEMPYYVVNFMDGFRESVIEPFVRAYECGRTPNPCIDCNRYMKFDGLFQRAQAMECDYMVTGHYARIEYDGAAERHLLLRAVDDHKDQSYVLYAMTQDQLAHTRFPLGGLTKDVVRNIAEAQGFFNARKHDSQDLCFVPQGNYAQFIRQFTGKTYETGDFVDTSGRVLGQHKGIIHYTIGQRKGLGLALDAPMYVKAIDIKNNRVVLGYERELYSDRVVAEDVNWIAVPSLRQGRRLKAKLRYRHQAQWAWVEQIEDDRNAAGSGSPNGKDGGRVLMVFEEPQRAVTSGQAAVFYDGDVVVGGGTIL